MENQISIIINGVRYDAVELDEELHPACSKCDLNNKNHDCLKIMSCPLRKGFTFKKSDKKFEV